MDELIKRIADHVGIDETVASQAVGIILNFLRKEGPDDAIAQLFAQLPGALAMAEQAEGQSGGGGFLGAFGGGVMAVMGKLQGLGLGMGEIQSVTKEVVGFAREKAGDDAVNAVISAIPGVSQFV